MACMLNIAGQPTLVYLCAARPQISAFAPNDSSFGGIMKRADMPSWRIFWVKQATGLARSYGAAIFQSKCRIVVDNFLAPHGAFLLTPQFASLEKFGWVAWWVALGGLITDFQPYLINRKVLSTNIATEKVNLVRLSFYTENIKFDIRSNQESKIATKCLLHLGVASVAK